jgi:hypothetical protein
VLFFCSVEGRLFFGEQLFDGFPLRRIRYGFEHLPIVLDILSMDKAFHSLAFHQFLFRPFAPGQSGFAPTMISYDIACLNGNQSRQLRHISSWNLASMIKANTTHWCSPASAMVWVGAI